MKARGAICESELEQLARTRRLFSKATADVHGSVIVSASFMMLATTGDLIPPRRNRSGWLGISLFIMITDIFPFVQIYFGFLFFFF